MPVYGQRSVQWMRMQPIRSATALSNLHKLIGQASSCLNILPISSQRKASTASEGTKSAHTGYAGRSSSMRNARHGMKGSSLAGSIPGTPVVIVPVVEHRLPVIVRGNQQKATRPVHLLSFAQTAKCEAMPTVMQVLSLVSACLQDIDHRKSLQLLR